MESHTVNSIISLQLVQQRVCNLVLRSSLLADWDQQGGMVANPARDQLDRPENSVSRDRFGCTVPLQPFFFPHPG